MLQMFTKIKQTARHPSATKINPPSHSSLINKNRSTDGCIKPCWADSVLERAGRGDHKGSTDSHEFSACFYVGVRLVSSHMAFPCTSLLLKKLQMKVIIP